jgi:chromate transport protein ChrA
MTEMPIDAPPSTNTRAVRLTEIARIFLKIGAMSYGVGIIGIMQSEVQEKRQWIGKEEFVQGLALVNMLPGPPGAQRTARKPAFALTTSAVCRQQG